MDEKRITRERYLKVRQTFEFDEEFIYDVYLDSNPDKPVEFEVCMANINNNLYWNDMSINTLLKLMINFYDVHFTVVTLRNQDGIVLKVF